MEDGAVGQNLESGPPKDHPSRGFKVGRYPDLPHAQTAIYDSKVNLFFKTGNIPSTWS
jgi:hypothetical protein